FDLNETITDEVAFRDAIRAAVGIEAYTMLLTGELFTTRTIDVPAAATAAWWQNPVNQVDGGTYKLWASSRFFMQNVGSLSNTVVFNNSCYSGAKRFSGARGARGNTITPEGITVANAILSRSPIAYYGWRFDDETSEKLENGAAILAAENMVDRLVENDSTGLWNLKAGNDEAIIDHFHRRPLVLTHDRHPGYCYEEAACGTFEDPRDGQVYKLACIGGKKW